MHGQGFGAISDYSYGHWSAKLTQEEVEYLESKCISRDTGKGPTTIEIESTAEQLRPTISTWYKGLRAVALVGLLSVLVYVGIRIIISSTGQEKAKYKKMISDWLVAICILFVLHYIMAFTMTMVEQITGIFEVNVIGENQEDILMSSIRNNIDDTQYSSLTSFTNLILYLVLVIYTCIFTIHYLKRLAYLAFFTMIYFFSSNMETYPASTITISKVSTLKSKIVIFLFL